LGAGVDKPGFLTVSAVAIQAPDRIDLMCCTIVNNPFTNRLSGLFHKKFIFCRTGPRARS